MEAADLVLPPGRNAPLRPIAEVASGNEQENAHATAAGTGARRYHSPKGICPSTTSRRILADPPWTKLEADSRADVRVGKETSRAARRSEELAAIISVVDTVPVPRHEDEEGIWFASPGSKRAARARRYSAPRRPCRWDFELAQPLTANRARAPDR